MERFLIRSISIGEDTSLGGSFQLVILCLSITQFHASTLRSFLTRMEGWLDILSLNLHLDIVVLLDLLFLYAVTGYMFFFFIKSKILLGKRVGLACFRDSASSSGFHLFDVG